MIKAIHIRLRHRACFLLFLALCAAAPLAGRAGPQLTVLPGFKVEMIHASRRGEGSWICMTADPQGRLIIAQQGGVGNMLRVTLSSAGRVEKIEKITLPVGSAMGLLYAFDSLYVNGMGPDGFGLYRLHDNRQSDRYDGVKLIRKLDGEPNSEHGGHGIVLGPDGHIYMVCGNFTLPPKDTSAASPLRNYGTDFLLPQDDDPSGWSVGNKPPEGFVLRTDAEGAKWELFAGGMRNDYDIAFNRDGELFGFDSDAENEWGLPWYRPIRFLHLVSGGEYGFREGTGKWPSWYADSLPPLLNVGLGSPTGLKFGTRSAFPDKYKKALFALDWSYGRIFAVHFTPVGADLPRDLRGFSQGRAFEPDQPGLRSGRRHVFHHRRARHGGGVVSGDLHRAGAGAGRPQGFESRGAGAAVAAQVGSLSRRGQLRSRWLPLALSQQRRSFHPFRRPRGAGDPAAGSMGRARLVGETAQGRPDRVAGAGPMRRKRDAGPLAAGAGPVSA